MLQTPFKTTVVAQILIIRNILFTELLGPSAFR
jgi:hypothetical protein